jgi:hypothetical protein
MLLKSIVQLVNKPTDYIANWAGENYLLQLVNETLSFDVQSIYILSFTSSVHYKYGFSLYS